MDTSKCISGMIAVVLVFGGIAILLSEVAHWEYAGLVPLVGFAVVLALWAKGIA